MLPVREGKGERVGTAAAAIVVVRSVMENGGMYSRLANKYSDLLPLRNTGACLLLTSPSHFAHMWHVNIP